MKKKLLLIIAAAATCLFASCQKEDLAAIEAPAQQETEIIDLAAITPQEIAEINSDTPITDEVAAYMRALESFIYDCIGKGVTAVEDLVQAASIFGAIAIATPFYIAENIRQDINEQIGKILHDIDIQTRNAINNIDIDTDGTRPWADDNIMTLFGGYHVGTYVDLFNAWDIDIDGNYDKTITRHNLDTYSRTTTGAWIEIPDSPFRGRIAITNRSGINDDLGLKKIDSRELSIALTAPETENYLAAPSEDEVVFEAKFAITKVANGANTTYTTSSRLLLGETPFFANSNTFNEGSKEVKSVTFVPGFRISKDTDYETYKATIRVGNENGFNGTLKTKNTFAFDLVMGATIYSQFLGLPTVVAEMINDLWRSGLFFSEGNEFNFMRTPNVPEDGIYTTRLEMETETFSTIIFEGAPIAPIDNRESLNLYFRGPSDVTSKTEYYNYGAYVYVGDLLDPDDDEVWGDFWYNWDQVLNNPEP